MNICVFGDSIAKGVIYDCDRDKYVFSQNSFLDIIARNNGIVFKNYARFGCTTVKGEAIIEKHLDELSSYDYTFLEFGGNDCDLDWKAASEHPDVPQTGQVGIDDFVRNYENIIDMVKAHGGTPVLMTLPPLSPDRFFSWVTRELDKFNVMKFLKNDRMNIYRWQKEYSDRIFQIGEDTGTPVLDIRKPFLESSSLNELTCIDGMHPNEKGHMAIAGFLADEWVDLAKRSSNIMDWTTLLPFDFSSAYFGKDLADECL